MRLHLLRHGIAVDRDDPNCPPDPERPLTPDGRKRTRRSGTGLRVLGVTPAAVWSSPYVRAQETARIVAEILDFPSNRIFLSKALLPDADPADVLSELAGDTAAEVLLVGHAPHLDRLVARILGARASVTSLRKAGAASLEVDLGGLPGMLHWLLEAGTLRRLGE